MKNGCTMQKAIILGIMCALITSGCMGVRTINIEGIKTLTLAELEKEGEELGDTLTNGEPLVIRIAEGESIPVKLKTELPFMKLETGENTIEFTKETFLHVSSKGVMISPDREKWAPIHKGKAIKKLYGAQQGHLSIGLSVDEKEGPLLMVGMGLK